MNTETLLILPSGERQASVDSGSIQFIGNATVLIRFGGLTLLTDPTFIHRHERVSIGYGMHSTRLTDPAMRIEDLPPLDVIVLSHYHGDHFDQEAERGLDKAVPIVTTRAAAEVLRLKGFRQSKPLDTWSSMVVEKGDLRLRITALPGRHGPAIAHVFLPPVMGSLVEFHAPQARPFRLYITGDTLVYDDLREIPRRYPDIDLALLHLGGTKVLGLLLTMDAAQGVDMLRLVQPRQAIPIHFNDYDVFTSPLSDFSRAVEAAGFEDRVHYLTHGQTYTFATARQAAA